ncbi:MAG: FxsA family protein [bacterium]|nr:FxsA family protein [bacterium]MCP5044650.1 FxsA family protein [bacterium]
MGKLLLLFVGLPALELWLLIEIGRRIGSLETIALIVVTGIVGASLARNQGLRVLNEVQQRVAAGEMPADSLVDGIMILVASALLVTPGILTDVFGFLCLVPGFRSRVKAEVIRRFERAVAENRVHVEYHDTRGSSFSGAGPFFGEPPAPMKDITPPHKDPEP